MNMSMRSRYLLLVFVTALILAGLLSGCGATTEHASELQAVPGQVQPGDANKLPSDIQSLSITIDNGKLDYDIYTMQPGTVQLAVATIGGPYKLTIEKLMLGEDLAANTKKNVGLTAATPGEYTISVSNTDGGDPTDTAVLNIRQVGGQ